MAGADRLAELQAALGYDFARPELLDEALTHASAAESGAWRSLERLEFLGDRVLSLVLAETLFRRYADESEGDLARRHALLASHDTLAGIGDGMGLGRYLRLQPGVAGDAGELPPSILEDALEAVIGALYLDGGLDAAAPVIERHWMPLMTGPPPRDPKTELQEWAQARALALPVYDTVAVDGPAHAPVFTVEATLAGLAPVRACGRSKRVAEREAAAVLLDRARAGDG